MSKPYPVLCKECKYSVPEENSTWNLRCTNSLVNANDPWLYLPIQEEFTVQIVERKEKLNGSQNVGLKVSFGR